MDGASPITFSRERNEELEAEITELAGHLNAATHHWLMLIAEFDDRAGWSGVGTQSCAHWLNWKCGIDIGAAREKVRVAHALQSLPKISASMKKGELSYSKVRALTRIANPENEDVLLMTALHGTANHVEQLVRKFRRILDAQEVSREAQQQANRSVNYHWDEQDGSLILKARLPADAGALVLKALEIAMENIEPRYVNPIDAYLADHPEPVEGRSDVSAETPTVKLASTARADALALMAESFLAHGVEAMSSSDKHQVVIHVSAETLQQKDVGQCELEDGPSISSETARRIACDCSVVAITEDEDGTPLDIGRKTRTISPALQRALKSRDKGCRFPGCCNSRYTHAHHIEHWANGGHTRLNNLVTLCTFHHRLVHEGGVQIQSLDDGALRFVKPNGESYDQVVCIDTNWKQLKLTNTEHGICVDANTATTRWLGEKMDYGLAVESFLFFEANAKIVSAGRVGLRARFPSPLVGEG